MQQQVTTQDSDSPFSVVTRDLQLCAEHKRKLNRDSKLCLQMALSSAGLWGFCNGVPIFC